MEFNDCLGLSKGRMSEDDMDIIARMLPGVESVEKASKSLDLRGVDYVARLSSGVEITVDAKYRDTEIKGRRGGRRASRLFWRRSEEWPDGEPELTLEVWSVMASHENKPVRGWTRDSRKLTDFVLFKWHPDDTRECFLLSFQMLRVAFARCWWAWKRIPRYRKNIQPNYDRRRGLRWDSQCVYMPVGTVLRAIEAASRGVAWESLGKDIEPVHRTRQLGLFVNREATA